MAPEQLPLLELPAPGTFAEPKIKQASSPVWTENKARLIERYLYFFVLVTKHGTYIDGFAGPQEPERPEMWAAKLVLESEPSRLRHFYLFEKKRFKAKLLEDLRAERRGRGDEREVEIYHGDFNTRVHEVLRPNKISQQEAAFCLLDQQTFECHWASVEALARFKEKAKHKVELFYFFPNHWFRRAIVPIKNDDIISAWWGRDDWRRLRTMQPAHVLEELTRRLKAELNYSSVKAWPIHSRRYGGSIMYYMIHATDHPEAPNLMLRAYELAVQPLEKAEQLELALPGPSGRVDPAQGDG